MDQDIIEVLEYNLLSELKRKELSKVQRAMLLKDYMKRKNISVRELAKEFNVPHTTLFYWANDEKRQEHIQSIKSACAHKELSVIVDSLNNFLKMIESHTVRIKYEDRIAIEKIKDIGHKMYLLTRTVRV